MNIFVLGGSEEGEYGSLCQENQESPQPDEVPSSNEHQPHHGSSPVQISRVRMEKIIEERGIEFYQLGDSHSVCRVKNRRNVLKLRSGTPYFSRSVFHSRLIAGI